MTSPSDLKAMPGAERLRRLYQLHNDKDFAAIARLGSDHIATAPLVEALIVANACYRCGDCDGALAALLRRPVEEQFADRHINLLLGLARRAGNWRALIEVSKTALRRQPARAEVFGYIATALRRLRRTREVKRLGAHMLWRYRRGRMPASLLIDILRAMRTRRPVLDLERDIGPDSELSTRIAFIEALVELFELDHALAAMARLGITPDALSPANAETIRHFVARKSAFGAASLAELRSALLQSVSGLGAAKLAMRPSAGRRRVLVVASSLGIGGSERQLSYLLDWLARAPGCADVVVYCQTRKAHRRARLPMAGRVLFAGDEETTEMGRRFEGMLDGGSLDDLRVAFGVSAIAEICGLAASLRPDVIYCPVGLPSEALITARIMGLEEVVVRFGGASFYNNFDGSDDNERRIAVAEFCCLAAGPRVRFVTNSRSARAAWMQRLNIPLSRIAVIPNGVPAPDATNRAPDDRLDLPQDAFVVGWVGRFHDIKRPGLWLDVALAVARRHRNVRYLMVGDGPLRSACEARIARHELSDRFIFAGLVSGSLARHYRAMDLLLQTSQTESFPNVVLEALSYGVEVVAGAVGDVAAILSDDQLGQAVAGDDAAAFVAAVETSLAKGRSIPAARKERAGHVRERYSIAAMCQAYAHLLGISAPASPDRAGLDAKPLLAAQKLT